MDAYNWTPPYVAFDYSTKEMILTNGSRMSLFELEEERHRLTVLIDLITMACWEQKSPLAQIGGE